MGVTLRWWRARDLSLEEALVAAAPALGEGAVGMLLPLPPGRFSFAVLEGGRLTGPDGDLDPGLVYEARVFSERVELRWVAEPGRRRDGALLGRAVVVAEDGAGPQGWGSGSREGLEVLEQRYLLWGAASGAGPAQGWSDLAEARIGPLPVPLGGLGSGERIALAAREYVGRGDHGNAEVVDERLLRLERLAGAAEGEAGRPGRAGGGKEG